VLNVTDVTRERQQAGSIKARLTLRGVVGEALTLYAREPGRIALTALVTFLPIDVLTVQLHGWSRHFLEIGHTGLSGGTEFIIFLLVTGGQVFLAGVLDHLEGARLGNESADGLFHVYRHLPLVRLFAADLVVSALASIASLAFVLPGVIAFALFGIVGPVINIEDRGVVGALRRSASLTYPHLGLSILLIVLPLTVEVAVEDWYVAFAHANDVALDLAVSVFLSVTVRAFVALLEVVLGHRLIHADRSAQSLQPSGA